MFRFKLISSYCTTYLKYKFCFLNKILSASQSHATFPFVSEKCLISTSPKPKQTKSAVDLKLNIEQKLCKLTKKNISTNPVDPPDRLPNFFETNSELNKDQVQVLYQVLDEIVEDIGNISFVNEATVANERVKTVAKYILPHGLTGATVFLATDRFYAKQRIAHGNKLTDEMDHFRLTCVLCWTIHMYHVHAAMQDDILDGNDTRNNLKCWHALEGNSPHAIRDTELMQDLIFIILKKYFKPKDYYIDLVEIMHECMYSTYIGLSEMENLQPSTNIYKPKPANLLLPGKKYAYCIFQYKAIGAAMLMNGVKASDLNSRFREICIDVGLIMALSEDYIDCYADERVNEREATDIPEGKQTWLYWKALELSSPAQAKLLMKSYGNKDVDCVKTVKSIYADLNIQTEMKHMIQVLEKGVEAKVAVQKEQQPDGPWPVILNFMEYYRGVRGGMFSRA